MWTNKKRLIQWIKTKNLVTSQVYHHTSPAIFAFALSANMDMRYKGN